MARLLYKCRLCGKIDDSLGIDDKYASNVFRDLIISGKCTSFGGHIATMHESHTCIVNTEKDTIAQIGVTDFIGVRMEEK